MMKVQLLFSPRLALPSKCNDDAERSRRQLKTHVKDDEERFEKYKLLTKLRNNLPRATIILQCHKHTETRFHQCARLVQMIAHNLTKQSSLVLQSS